MSYVFGDFAITLTHICNKNKLKATGVKISLMKQYNIYACLNNIPYFKTRGVHEVRFSFYSVIKSETFNEECCLHASFLISKVFSCEMPIDKLQLFMVLVNEVSLTSQEKQLRAFVSDDSIHTWLYEFKFENWCQLL